MRQARATTPPPNVIAPKSPTISASASGTRASFSLSESLQSPFDKLRVRGELYPSCWSVRCRYRLSKHACGGIPFGWIMH
jgi:hypothetical protein